MIMTLKGPAQKLNWGNLHEGILAQLGPEKSLLEKHVMISDFFASNNLTLIYNQTKNWKDIIYRVDLHWKLLFSWKLHFK